MVRPRLIIVIPCHNEAATLGDVVRGAVRHGEVLVVDDRSTDASRAVAEAAGARVVPSGAPGYDGALTTGLRQAFEEGTDFVLTLDADGEHDPALAAEFRAAFEAGADLICGIRVRPQRAAERVVAVVGRAAFGISDLLCGMKGYSRAVLQAHFDSGCPLTLNMAPAVTWRRAGGDLTQIAVTGQVRSDTPRFGRALKANVAILRAFAAVMTETRP